MLRTGLAFFLMLYFSIPVLSQQLIINEVSQGQGAAEYVEFVVIGEHTCQTPVPCIDLRKVIIDDNNGYFAPGSGTGIAAGAVRFSNSAFWSCIPQGTFIVIYNEADINTLLPPADSSLNDGNCQLILPANSLLLERTTVNFPSSTSPLYPDDSLWSVGGNWASLAMSNSNDSFQIPNLQVNGTPHHAISWGNNTNGSIIYFAGSASNLVFSFINSNSNDWNLQENWMAGTVGINETPGEANSPENAAWIATMNPTCGTPPDFTTGVSFLNTSCTSACDGSISLNFTENAEIYSINWSNGDTLSSLNELCSGIYSYFVQNTQTCAIDSGTIEITANQTLSDASFFLIDELTLDSAPVNALPTEIGGQWSADCGSCISSDGIFNPQISGIGTFQICYETGSGSCSEIYCDSIEVTENCQSEMITQEITLCSGDSYLFGNSFLNQGGVYTITEINSLGCDSTTLLNLSFFNRQDTTNSISLCEGDSVWIHDHWQMTTGFYSIEKTDTNGCTYTLSWNIQLSDCYDEPFLLFVPNAFTPDKGSVNSIFEIVLSGGILSEGFVMNRWGEIVANFSENKLNWNGFNKTGEPVPDGVYVYKLICITNKMEKIEKVGFVTIIR